jgi:prepilin peptidase CpaA
MADVSFTLLVALEIVLALILVVAAAIDIRTFTISNRLNLTVALLAIPYWFAAHVPLWPGVAILVGIAIGVFFLLSLAFAAGMMGGGDVKLAGAMALWFTPDETMRFLVYMSIVGGVLTLGLMAYHKARKRPNWPEIPYGVAIAAGGLAILAQRFLNQFV